MSTRGLRMRLAGAAALSVLLYVVFLVVDFEPDPLRLTLLVIAGVAALGLVVDGVSREEPSWAVGPVHPSTPPGQDPKFSSYVRVIEGHLTVDVPDGVLRDRLAAVAAQRLEQRHGVRRDDPRAAELLGPEVAAVLTGPVRRLSRAEIDRCVQRIEDL